MLKFLLRILLNGAGIYIASSFIGGFTFQGSILQYGLAALILTAVNFVFGGFLRFIFRPLIFITLGIFSIIISMAALWITDFFLDSLTISNLTALFLTTLIITVLNLPLIKGFHSKKS